MSKWLIAGSSVLIATATLIVGIGCFVVTAPLFMITDPNTGARIETASHGSVCLHMALALVSASVGFGLLGSSKQSQLDATLAGALAGALLCLSWIVKETSRGIALSQLWSWSMLAAIALAGVCATLGSRAALALRSRRQR